MPKFRLGHTWDEIKEKCESGEWQAHSYPHGICFTEVRKFPEEKVCFVHFLAGEKFDSWKQKLDDDLRVFAKAQGCHALEASMRLGLGKKLKPLGWKLWHVIMRKELK